MKFAVFALFLICLFATSFQAVVAEKKVLSVIVESKDFHPLNANLTHILSIPASAAKDAMTYAFSKIKQLNNLSFGKGSEVGVTEVLLDVELEGGVSVETLAKKISDNGEIISRLVEAAWERPLGGITIEPFEAKEIVIPSTCHNNQKDAGETDVDCGGSCPQACLVGKSCRHGFDCLSGICKAGVCGAVPNPYAPATDNATALSVFFALALASIAMLMF